MLYKFCANAIFIRLLHQLMYWSAPDLREKVESHEIECDSEEEIKYFFAMYYWALSGFFFIVFWKIYFFQRQLICIYFFFFLIYNKYLCIFIYYIYPLIFSYTQQYQWLGFNYRRALKFLENKSMFLQNNWNIVFE